MTPVEGLKFKTSFNFDLTDYNTLDYTNPKIGPAVNTGAEQAAAIPVPSLGLGTTL